MAGLNSAVLVSLTGPLVTWMGASSKELVAVLPVFSALWASPKLGRPSGCSTPTGRCRCSSPRALILGLDGIDLRLPGESRGEVAIVSREMVQRLWQFVKANFLLFVLLSVPFMLSSGGGGIAWEAHLGGCGTGLPLARWVVVQADG